MLTADISPEEFARVPGYRADGKAFARTPPPQPVLVLAEDDPAWIAGFMTAKTNLALGAPIRHLRFATADRRRAGIAVLHTIGPIGEAELFAWATPGLWHRSVLRVLALWIFDACEMRRLVMRIPADAPRLKGYARRLGFKHEGRLRGYFPDGADASLWAMLPAECPWLR